jgi:hypothetical protein
VWFLLRRLVFDLSASPFHMLLGLAGIVFAQRGRT